MKSRLLLLTAVLASCLAAPGLAGSTTIDLGAIVQPPPLTARFADPGYFVWDGAAVKGHDGIIEKARSAPTCTSRSGRRLTANVCTPNSADL